MTATRKPRTASGVYPLAVQPQAPAASLTAVDAVRDEVLAAAARLVVAVLSQRPFRVPRTAAEVRYFAAQAQSLVDLEDRVNVALAAGRARDMATWARIGLENAASALEYLDRGALDTAGGFASNLRYAVRQVCGA